MEDPGFLVGLVHFIALSAIGVVVIAATRRHRATLRFQAGLFLLAFALRFAMSVAIYEGGLVDVLKDEDGSGWVGGEAFLLEWDNHGVGLLDLPVILAGAFGEHNHGYWYLLGTLFYLTHLPARLAAAALNGFFGAMTVVVTYRTAWTLFSPWVAARAAWLTCLFPSMIIWSAQTIKEPVVILLEALALYGCVSLKRFGFKVGPVLLTSIACVLMIPFRFYAFYVAVAAVLITLALPRLRGRGIGLVPALGVVLLLAPFLAMTGVLAAHESQFEKFDLNYINNMKKYGSSTSGSGIATNYDLRTPLGMGLSLAVGAVHLLLAPFPWQLARGSLRMLLVGPEMVYWWWLVFAAMLPGLRHALRHHFHDILPLLIMILGFGLLYSLMFSNVGLVYRQRAQLLPWFFILAAVGLELRRRRRLAPRGAGTSAVAWEPAPPLTAAPSAATGHLAPF